MTKDQLRSQLRDAYDNWLIDDDFGGSSEEAAEANGRAEAFSTALCWVEDYFRTQKE